MSHEATKAAIEQARNRNHEFNGTVVRFERRTVDDRIKLVYDFEGNGSHNARKLVNDHGFLIGRPGKLFKLIDNGLAL